MVLMIHLFPLFWLTFPITMPLALFMAKRRMDNERPACTRGMMVVLTTPRGRALKARLNQPEGR